MRTNTVDFEFEIDVLHFSTVIAMSEDLYHFNFENIIWKIIWENWKILRTYLMDNPFYIYKKT